tara:strand:+ start:1970 stop:2233 length:264 start_codon:yes stop_codon:yes gene_type:complete
MIDDKKCELVINKFFEALKAAKEDYTIEGTGLTYHMTLELIRVSVKESITGNEDLFENLVSWIINASMYLLNDTDELNEIDLLRKAI